MARRTFGPSGRVVDILDGAAGQTVRIVETEPDRDDQPSIEDHGVGGVELPAFEPVGESVRVESESDAESESGTGATYTDPATASGGRRLNKDGTPRKRRGEGKQSKATPQDRSFVTANLEKVLYALHTMAAGLLAEPDLAIDEDESKLLAEAVEKVANAYNFTTLLSPKTQAGVDMIIALATVYGPRVIKIAKRPKHPMRNVTPISQTGTESK